MKISLIHEFADGGKTLHRTESDYLVGHLLMVCEQVKKGSPIVRVAKATAPSSVDTGMPAYDRKINAHLPFMTGNVISNFQVSTFVRAPHEVECNDRTFPRGELTHFDLAYFDRARIHSLLNWYKHWHADHPSETTIAYLLRDWHGGGSTPIQRGWIVTSTTGRVLMSEVLSTGGGRNAAKRILDEARAWLSAAHATVGQVLIEFRNGALEVLDPVLRSQLPAVAAGTGRAQ